MLEFCLHPVPCPRPRHDHYSVFSCYWCEDISPQLCVRDDPSLSTSFTVIVSTEVTDGQGSKVQPCTVEVTVLPRYHGNDCHDKDL